MRILTNTERMRLFEILDQIKFSKSHTDKANYIKEALKIAHDNPSEIDAWYKNKTFVNQKKINSILDDIHAYYQQQCSTPDKIEKENSTIEAFEERYIKAYNFHYAAEYNASLYYDAKLRDIIAAKNTGKELSAEDSKYLDEKLRKMEASTESCVDAIDLSEEVSIVPIKADDVLCQRQPTIIERKLTNSERKRLYELAIEIDRAPETSVEAIPHLWLEAISIMHGDTQEIANWYQNQNQFSVKKLNQGHDDFINFVRQLGGKSNFEQEKLFFDRYVIAYNFHHEVVYNTTLDKDARLHAIEHAEKNGQVLKPEDLLYKQQQLQDIDALVKQRVDAINLNHSVAVVNNKLICQQYTQDIEKWERKPQWQGRWYISVEDSRYHDSHTVGSANATATSVAASIKQGAVQNRKWEMKDKKIDLNATKHNFYYSATEDTMALKSTANPAQPKWDYTIGDDETKFIAKGGGTQYFIPPNNIGKPEMQHLTKNNNPSLFHEKVAKPLAAVTVQNWYRKIHNKSENKENVDVDMEKNDPVDFKRNLTAIKDNDPDFVDKKNIKKGKFTPKEGEPDTDIITPLRPS